MGGVEPPTTGCKPVAFPVKLHPQNFFRTVRHCSLVPVLCIGAMSSISATQANRSSCTSMQILVEHPRLELGSQTCEACALPGELMPRKLFTSQPLHFHVPLVTFNHAMHTAITVRAALLSTTQPPSVIGRFISPTPPGEQNSPTPVAPYFARKASLRSRARMLHVDAAPFVRRATW